MTPTQSRSPTGYALDSYQSSALCSHATGPDDESSGFDFWLGESPPEGRDPQRVALSGDIHQEVTWEGLGPDGHQFAQLRILSFKMSGEHPELGTLEVNLDPSRTGSVAFLRAECAGEKYPAVHTTRLHVVATASVLPGVLLQNRGAPLELVSEPTPIWPPESTIYRLGIPVVFEDRQNPGCAAATASNGTITVGAQT